MSLDQRRTAQIPAHFFEILVEYSENKSLNERNTEGRIRARAVAKKCLSRMNNNVVLGFYLLSLIFVFNIIICTII